MRTKDFNPHASLSRRTWLTAGLACASGLALRSLATGVPRQVLIDPLAPPRALAQGLVPARVLILSTSLAGDPLNANVPGTYGPGLDNVVHPLSPEMRPTALQLAGRSWTAAKPWAELPRAVLDRTVFFHHGTYANSHPSHPKVMRLMGHVNGGEMMVSLFAKHVGERLGTTQVEPISLGARLGGELLSFEGRTLSNVRPSALRQVLGRPRGPLGRLQELRDRDLDRLHALYRNHGTENHRRFLDRIAQSRNEARNISEAYLERLEQVTGDGIDHQITAAPILAAMNLSPVITVNIRFGSDNHRDAELRRETDETVSGVERLGRLATNIEELRSAGVLRTEVVVAAMNVFGRTLSIDHNGYNGRDHNSRHHCSVMIGPGFRPGVVGGIERFGGDWSATSFDSASGQTAADGDVPFEETLQSMAKTLGAALGVPRARLDENISGGAFIRSVLA